jgi:DNA repair protein RadC
MRRSAAALQDGAYAGDTDTSNSRKPPLHRIPVYEIRLVQSRRPLRLAETTVSDGDIAGRTLHAMLGLTDREHFAALFVNGTHQVTGAHVVAIGGQQGIGTIEVRTVFRAAITACAVAVVLGHNHPSADPTPSPEDIATTRKLMAAGKLLGIPVLDHVIVTRDPRRWHSMLTRGTMPAEG